MSIPPPNWRAPRVAQVRDYDELKTKNFLETLHAA